MTTMVQRMSLCGMVLFMMAGPEAQAQLTVDRIRYGLSLLSDEGDLRDEQDDSADVTLDQLPRSNALNSSAGGAAGSAEYSLDASATPTELTATASGMVTGSLSPPNPNARRSSPFSNITFTVGDIRSSEIETSCSDRKLSTTN